MDYQEPSNFFEQKKMFQDLQESPAFRKLCEKVQEQCDALQDAIIFSPVLGEADVYARERDKGRLEGRLSLQATLTTLLEELEYDYQHALEAKEQRNVD